MSDNTKRIRAGSIIQTEPYPPAGAMNTGIAVINAWSGAGPDKELDGFVDNELVLSQSGGGRLAITLIIPPGKQGHIVLTPISGNSPSLNVHEFFL